MGHSDKQLQTLEHFVHDLIHSDPTIEEVWQLFQFDVPKSNHVSI